MEILKSLRKDLGLTQQDVANNIGLAKNTYANYETGYREPNFEMLSKLADFFGVSIDLLLGRQSDPQVSREKYTSSGKAYKTYPVYGRIACGIEMELVDDIVDWEDIPSEMYCKGELLLTRAHGSSMSPVIDDGDTVILLRSQTARNGAICAVRINGDLGTLKKINVMPNGLELVPLNSEYAPMFYTDKQVESYPISIIGVLLEVRKKFNFA